MSPLRGTGRQPTLRYPAFQTVSYPPLAGPQDSEYRHIPQAGYLLHREHVPIGRGKAHLHHPNGCSMAGAKQPHWLVCERGRVSTVVHTRIVRRHDLYQAVECDTVTVFSDQLDMSVYHPG